jgi:hypothetical protein
MTTCEEDAIDTKPLTLLQALRIVYWYAITVLTLNSIAYFASGATMLASKIYLLAILFILGLYVIYDAYDGVDVPVEVPVATAKHAAPLRRSRRVAAQFSRASYMEVAREVARGRRSKICSRSQLQYVCNQWYSSLGMTRGQGPSEWQAPFGLSLMEKRHGGFKRKRDRDREVTKRHGDGRSNL